MSYRRVKRGGSSGLGKLTLLVFGVIGAAVGFSAYHVAPFYYYYFEVVNQMDAAIRNASIFTDQELREKLMYHIKKYQIPIENPEDLLIEREEGHMRISMKYEEVFYVTWQGKDYEIHTFPFHAYAEGDY